MDAHGCNSSRNYICNSICNAYSTRTDHCCFSSSCSYSFKWSSIQIIWQGQDQVRKIGSENNKCRYKNFQSKMTGGCRLIGIKSSSNKEAVGCNTLVYVL